MNETSFNLTGKAQWSRAPVEDSASTLDVLSHVRVLI
jgi:hypothetical protein